MTAFRLFLIFCAGMSLLALVLYGWDKCKARRRRWRIRESVLLGCALLGGAAGALLGMLLFRHKTRHWYFWAAVLLGLLWQIAAAVLLF